MIGTNRDLAIMQQLLDHEILRLHGLPSGMAKPAWINRRLASLCHQRIAICAARVNRRMEASKRVVEFSRWVNGDGALRDRLQHIRDAKAGQNQRRSQR